MMFFLKFLLSFLVFALISADSSDFHYNQSVGNKSGDVLKTLTHPTKKMAHSPSYSQKKEENLPEIGSETEAAKKIEENKIVVETEKRVLRRKFIIAETKNTKEELKRSFKKGATGQTSTTETPKKSVAQEKSLRNPKKPQ
ncbi:hypothetical protein JTB14_001393 [Gonioctena quinquepunctata]|nr:hypothetical protein JTB14_001393 [Gonioctena quinquepunctata]